MRLLLFTALLLVSVAGVKAQQRENTSILKSIKNGVASFYHDKFEGKKTATGEVFDNNKFTAASNTLRLGTYVKVTNLSNGQVIYVRINDRMDKNNNRVIDLASIAAKRLNFHRKGITKVKVEPVSDDEGRRAILAQKSVAAPNDNQL